MKTYCFDLDDTLCFPNHGESDSFEKYGKAKPNIQLIKKLNELKSQGNRIIIFTARRMLTHKGDIKKIYSDVGEITINWLSENGVVYDDLIFGKPYADYYIDDKAVKLDEV